jgi:hypothetical protein
MKIYTAYSESHEKFLPWFNTIKDVDPDIEISHYKLPQDCETAEFKHSGWNQVTGKKLQRMVEIFDEDSSDDSFIFSDIDVQFFSSVSKLSSKALKNHDIVFQNDYYGFECTGFFYCKKTKETKRMFEKALEIIKTYGDQSVDGPGGDQEAIQTSLKIHNSTVRRAFLPPQFFTFGMFYDHWKGQASFPLPKGIVMHHANWVIGVDNKIKLLQAVRNNYNNNNFLK